jgi:hypothetical protein
VLPSLSPDEEIAVTVNLYGKPPIRLATVAVNTAAGPAYPTVAKLADMCESWYTL